MKLTDQTPLPLPPYQPVLIIDDNDDYVVMIQKQLASASFRFDRAYNAKEGLEMLQRVGNSFYGLIITDITMEGQTAGLRLIRQIRRNGYRGALLVASTGFDIVLVQWLARPFMRLWGADILVPKVYLKQGVLKCLPLSRLGRRWLPSLLQ